MKQNFLENIIRNSKKLAVMGMAAASVACSKDEPDPTPTPTPKPQPKSIIIDIEAERPGVTYKAWEGGEALDTDTSGADGNAQLVIEPDLVSYDIAGKVASSAKAGTLDSITGVRNNQTYFFQENVSVSDTQPTTVPVNDYSHTINVDCNSGNATYQGYQEGSLVVSGNVDGDGFGDATFYNFERETTLDSLIFKPNFLDFQNVKFFNQIIGESKDYVVFFERASETLGSVGITPNIDGFAEQGFAATIDGQTYQTDGPNLVIENLQPGTYTVEITDLGADGNNFTEEDSEFLPFQGEVTIETGANNYSPVLEDVPQLQTLEFILRNDASQTFDNGTIEVYNTNGTELTNDDTLLGSGNGNLIVEDVPADTEFYAVTGGSGKYTTTMNSRRTKDDIQTIGDMTETYNVVNFSQRQLKDGSPMQAFQIEELMFDEWPVQVIATGKQYIHVPIGNIQSDLQVFFYNFYQELGRQTVFVSEPLPNDAPIQPYFDYPNYVVTEGSNGVNVDSYTGGSTDLVKVNLADGILGTVGAYSALDGLNYGGTGHEFERQLSVPASTAATLGFATATHSNKALNINPLESIGDLPIIKFLLDSGMYTVNASYRTQDGKPWNYALPKRFD